MKYQNFATRNFIGLKTLQREFLRSNFTFREHKDSLREILNMILFNIEEIKNYIQNDYWSDSKLFINIFSKSEGFMSFIKFLNSAASSSSFWVSVETTPEAKTASVT